MPPAVALTSPADGATFNAPASITITANATDSDGTVSRVEFFQGTTKLGEDTTAPYSFNWTNVTAGSYSLTARATDNAGSITASAAVNITVTSPNTLPSIVLTAPANGATFTAPATVPITANAIDEGGTVSLVEFFQGTTKLGEDATAPYSFNWTNVPAGSYTSTAKSAPTTSAVTHDERRDRDHGDPPANTPPTVNLHAHPPTAPRSPRRRRWR